MKIVDANVLLYAAAEDTRHHGSARRWLDEALNGNETIGLPWISLLAFVRIATKGIFEHPLTSGAALDYVDLWLAQSPVVVPEPTSRHARLLRQLLDDVGTGGNLTSDAHLAALALEHGADVCSFDNDFGRFDSVSWYRPAD